MIDEPVVHGVTCEKAPHCGDGYLHGEDDDGPYIVDGLEYCGRCHTWLRETPVTLLEIKEAARAVLCRKSIRATMPPEQWRKRQAERKALARAVGGLGVTANDDLWEAWPEKYGQKTERLAP